MSELDSVDPTRDRVVIVGGPSRGKSTTAHALWERSMGRVPVYCGDPASKVVHQKPYTVYLPEGLPFAGDGGAADWVTAHWFALPGPWICEGHVMARALRRWLSDEHQDRLRVESQHAGTLLYPCDRIIVLDRPAHRPTSTGQEAMHKGVMKVWDEIEDYFAPITIWLR